MRDLESFAEDREDYLVALSRLEDPLPAISLEDAIKRLEFDADLD
jgi:hypothetical protein